MDTVGKAIEKNDDPTVATAARKSRGGVIAARIAHWFLSSPIRLLIIPYAVGVVWHVLHPSASVLTGDLQQARKWYVDESSLDPSHFQVFAKYDLILQTKHSQMAPPNGDTKTSIITSLCHGVQVQSERIGVIIPCHRHVLSPDETSLISGFEIAKIVPLSAGVAPISEAVVLVVPTFVPFSDALIKVNYNGTTDNPNASSATDDKSRAQFQASLLQLIRRLASPQTSPWLAKTILFVAPLNEGQRQATEMHHRVSLSPILEETVQALLGAHLGAARRPNPQTTATTTTTRAGTNHALGDFLQGSILRTLLVLDLNLFQSENRPLPSGDDDEDDFEPEMNELRLLPQGRRGLLPNMDLTFVLKAVFDRSDMVELQQLSVQSNERHQMVEIMVHPYREVVETCWSWIEDMVHDYVGRDWELPSWGHALLHLMAFESVLALGPYPPHAPALERGMDAITVQGLFVSAHDGDDYDLAQGNVPRSKQSPQQYPMEMVQRMELVIRALSNLQERLHHSTSLYLLASKDRFVKHEEYLVPNLLLIIPLILRALLIVFSKDPPFVPNLGAAGHALALTAAWTIVAAWMVSSAVNPLRLAVAHASFAPPWVSGVCMEYETAILYFLVLLFFAFFRARTSIHFADLNTRRTIQFASCLMAACMHVSIAFGHVALAYPSALLWTPLLAFPTLQGSEGRSKSHVEWALSWSKLLLVVALSPFCFLVPYVFWTYTPYVRYVYTPLHILCFLVHVVPG
jgi:Gaa1-like, GPI transamidase component